MNHVAHTHEESTPASSKRPSVPPASLHRTLTDIAGEIEVAAVAVEHTTPELRWRISETLMRIAERLGTLADDVEAGAVEGREGDAADEPIAFRPVDMTPRPPPPSMAQLFDRAEALRNRVGLIQFAVRGLESEDGGVPLIDDALEELYEMAGDLMDGIEGAKRAEERR